MIRNHGLAAWRRLPPIAAALLAVAVSAQAAPSTTVDEVVARYIAARGGLQKLRSIQSLRQKGHLSTGAGRQALVTRELKRPSYTRFEFSVQGVTGVFVSDGRSGWHVSPFEGSVDPKPLTDEVVAEAAEQADIEGPLVDWKAKGHQADLVGRELVAGREAYKVKLTLKSGAARYEFIDVKNHHLIRTESTRQIRGRPVRLVTTYADFKKYGGVLFPRRIEVEAVGRPQRTLVVVDAVEINPALSDARFEMPAAAQP